MLARIRKSMEERDQGFTLIELLVVMIIIGILAAIAIPTFLNQRENAWEKAVESDIRNATVAAESYAVEHNGSYTGLDLPATDPTTELEANGYNATAEVNLVPTVAADGNSYTFAVTHDNLTGTWTYDSTTGTVTPPTHLNTRLGISRRR